MSSIPCNVVLLPNDKLATRVVTASKALEQFGTLFTLQAATYYPHASVYMLQLKTDDIPKANELLAEIAARINTLQLAASRYYQAKNFFDAEYYKTEQLGALQVAVVNALHPIRDGMRANDKARMLEATGLALENYKQYGWNTIGELYRPHLTITRFANEEQNPERVLPVVTEFSGQFSKLGLFEMGDNGTAIRKIIEFNLGR